MTANITDRLTVSSGGRFFELTDANVAPTRDAGVDENGLPREETICMLAKVEYFVDTKGNVRTVPLATGRVPSNEIEVQRYEMNMRIELIRAGWLPLGECPYTQEYKRQTGRPALIKLPEGASACDGAPGGCEHLLPVKLARAEKAKREFDAQQINTKNMTPEAIQAMAHALGAGIASHLKTADHGKAALRSGKGEKDA